MTKVYSKEYFSWQSSIGEFGGWANKIKFEAYIQKNDVVLDFGCGGGFLLKELACKERWGTDINPEALITASKNGIKTKSSLSEFSENYFDVIMSNHALEHVRNPLESLLNLFVILKKGGKIIFVIPCENSNFKYSQFDKNHHLFSWSPMSLANLFTEAGFEVLESKPYYHKWPPNYQFIAKFTGKNIFNLICKVYSRFDRKSTQVRIVAQKPRE